MSTIVYPFHYQVYWREGASWFAKNPRSVFYNGTNETMQLDKIPQQFGLTEKKVIIELFRINGGKPGYYLANLRDRKYYYCGLDWENIKTTLLNLGIGRVDPSDRSCL